MAQMTVTQPPGDLGPSGRQLWSAIMREHGVAGAGNLALLHEACRALDSAETFAAVIAREGVVVQCKSGPRDHPLIRHRHAASALTARLLMRLGVVVPAKRPPGRPVLNNIGIGYEQLRSRDGARR